ncbi:MAG: hypothetical protein DMG61_04685 [Acidobacteria bacterium]|nr:MAG: hypothetical protein DMG61_04685 [Acidobacteriota bacterium]PYY19986.1 MAG: hypothetical protein DMG60_02080 [Acidobacteriota bacterium]
MKHPLSSFVFACLLSVFAIPAVAQLQEPTQPINIIIDSDMSSDVDDVGDHAVLWALANRGEVNVLAIIASSANDYSAPVMRAIANYYAHSEVPIGAHKGSTPTVENAAWSPYAQGVANRFGTTGDTRFNYPDAVTVYRQTLAKAPDQSVYIVACGFYQPLQALLQSPPDAISPLTGRELVAQKVKRFVPSAGVYPYGSEHNFRVDADAAKYVIDNWPGEIVAVGFDVGVDVITGPSPSSDPGQDPVKFAYNLYASPTDPAWGQAALLFAARGGIGTNFSLDGYNGVITLEDASQSSPGYDIWFQTPNAGHSYVNKLMSASAMAAILNPLLQGSSNMPILRSISPSSVTVGASGQTISLTGTNFFSDSQVSINGSARTTTYVSGRQLNVQLNSSDLAQAGIQPLAVLNSSEGNWTSSKINLTILNPAPVLSSITPASVAAGTSGFTLTANGSGFVGASVVQVNGANRATTPVSGTQLTAAIPASDVAVGGYLSITASSPGPGGGTSGAVTLTVNNPRPAVSSVSPNPILAMSGTYTLTVSGSGFNRASAVTVDGKVIPTTLVSSTQLTAQVPNNDLLIGQHAVAVSNPGPGGGTSNSVTVTVISTLL